MHPFTYTKASTATEAIEAVAAGGTGTRYLAGGTTLYDLMKLNVETPTHVVDVTGLSSMREIDLSGDRELVFGALARMSDVGQRSEDYQRLSRTIRVALAGGVRAIAQHGYGRRQLTATHALCLFQVWRTLRLQ
jgi:xanthine dehydrogenase YagS FAD-binding subunit